MSYELIVDDCRTALAAMPEASVHCVVTSPPYWGLRDYGFEGQIGLEATPELYVQALVDVFRAVRRVLRPDGALWVNLGDSYATHRNDNDWLRSGALARKGWHGGNLKPKDLIGIPWRVAFALQADGWYLRSDVIWAKPNPMPESVQDRPTRSHEYLFLLSRSERYCYDAEAIREPHTATTNGGRFGRKAEPGRVQEGSAHSAMRTYHPGGRNRRSVWAIPTQPYPEAHFATFPPKLVEPCILAGTSERGCCAKCGAPWRRVVERTPMHVRPGPGREPLKAAASGATTRTAITGTMLEPSRSETIGWQPGCECGRPDVKPCTVLDPFAGSGTVGEVALKLDRRAVLVEASAEYADLIRKRLDPIAAQGVLDLGGAA